MTSRITKGGTLALTTTNTKCFQERKTDGILSDWANSLIDCTGFLQAPSQSFNHYI